jgi:hypothetical protein
MPAKARNIAVRAYQNAAATASTMTTPIVARMAVWMVDRDNPCAWLTMGLFSLVAPSFMAIPTHALARQPGAPGQTDANSTT